MSAPDLLTDADREAVRAAVAEAEQRTSGEIVPFVVPESDAYLNALWKGAALGALAGPLLALGLHRLWDLWVNRLDLWITAPAAAGAAAGFLLAAFVPPVKRWLAGDGMLELRTRQRAEMAFLEEEVFRTRERTGILLFLSLFEHRVVVLADSGIHTLVQPGQWDGIAADIAAGIRAGRPAEALLAAIRSCGDLLERHGVARQADDVNELPDELRGGGAPE
jgi:putative membrane protein